MPAPVRTVPTGKAVTGTPAVRVSVVVLVMVPVTAFVTEATMERPSASVCAREIV
jgi:hypothetical protein